MATARLAILTLAVSLLGAVAPAGAAELRDISVERDSGVIYVTSETFMAAPIEAVYDILTDYERFDRVSSTFVESRFLERQANGSGVVYTVAKGCIAFFCRSIARTEQLEVTAPTLIETQVIPERSDIKRGAARWALEAENGGTRVLYKMEMKPDFWIPPLLGTYLLKRSLSSAGYEAAQRIEDIALGRYSGSADGAAGTASSGD